MHVNTLLYASVALALPITLITLSLLYTRYDWRSYRVGVDVGRGGSAEGTESGDDGDLSELTITPTETESSEGPRPGAGGVRGWLRRNLYTYYRRN
ncbi:MAG: hypothetical protein ACI9PP_000074 [Halobacteriales archaeon]|jgi:hypothetical protein